MNLLREFPVKTERRAREEVTETRAPRVCLAGAEPTVCEVLKATPALPALLAVTGGWERLVRWVQLDRRAPWWREEGRGGALNDRVTAATPTGSVDGWC